MKFFARLFQRSHLHREPFRDVALGRIVWDGELCAWRIPAGEERNFEISVPGMETPDPLCLSYAQEIHVNQREFLERVRAELEAEALRFPKLAKVIRRLEVESVDISARGNGMVYFAGEEDAPLWRLDLIEGKVCNLGCDT